jgi:hypothetical protein
MARTVTLTQLQTRVRQRADAEGDPHVTDAEITGLINDAYTGLYDQLILSCPPDYFRTTNTFSTANGTVSYSLPTDFYKVRQVYSVDESGVFRPLNQIDEVARYSYRAPDGVYSVRLDYVPVAGTLTNANDTMDGINGWDEAVVLQAAIDIKNKKEDDPGALLAKKREVEERIRKLAQRDDGSPRHIVARNNYALGRRSWYTEATPRNHVDAYCVVGGNIEIYRFAGHLLP